MLTLAELIDFGCRVHFISLTVTYKKIYDIHTYFSGPMESTMKSYGFMLPEVGPEAGEGEKHPRRITRAKKQEKKIIGRYDLYSFSLLPKSDWSLHAVYVYRLCLEWA